jgi:hypothetical protein
MEPDRRTPVRYRKLLTERPTSPQPDPLARHRRWLVAAAIYNLVWGSVTLVLPGLFFDLAGIARPNYTAIWQVVGLFVLLYAPTYLAASRSPMRQGLLVLIGFAGKVAGPIGFTAGVITGTLPWQFVFVVLTNDLIWWPFFGRYVMDARREAGSWRELGSALLNTT